MNTGSILRGCIVEEEIKKENDIIEERIKEKVNEITKKTEKDCNILLDVFAEEMHKKIRNLDKYREELESKYKEECEKNKEETIEEIKNLEDKYLKVIKDQEDKMNLFIENTQDSIKDLMMILFEKFFYTQYNNPDNLKYIIKEGLQQLEDSKEIQVSLNKKILTETTGFEIDKIKKSIPSEVTLKFHSSDSLFLEFKSEQNNIEVDFNRQLEKIKDIIYSF